MGSDPRGCLESVKSWLFAPCDDDEPELPSEFHTHPMFAMIQRLCFLEKAY